jgi:carbon monoxide dehydrogenase subunit G
MHRRVRIDRQGVRQRIQGCDDGTGRAGLGKVHRSHHAERIVPPKSYTIKFEGQGGAAGFANGEAQVGLSPVGSGTRIDYKAKAQVGGKLAQIGSRLVDGAAAKVADDFFGRLVDHLGGGKKADEAVPTIPPAAAASALKTMRWRLVAAILIIVVMAIYWLTRPT